MLRKILPGLMPAAVVLALASVLVCALMAHEDRMAKAYWPHRFSRFNGWEIELGVLYDKERNPATRHQLRMQALGLHLAECDEDIVYRLNRALAQSCMQTRTTVDALPTDDQATVAADKAAIEAGN